MATDQNSQDFLCVEVSGRRWEKDKILSACTQENSEEG